MRRAVVLMMTNVVVDCVVVGRSQMLEEKGKGRREKGA
jgi:hypothetical protein